VNHNLSGGFSLLMLGSLILLAADARLFAQPSRPASSGPAKSARALPGPVADRANANSNANADSKATLADFAWLEGKWQGSWGPRVAEQIWMEPKAGEILGLFRVLENDKTLVIELYSLLETPDGIEFRLRHFTETLMPWEQSTTAVLKLATFDSKAAAFENSPGGQPKRITLIRTDAENYISQSVITSASGTQQVTDIRYHKLQSIAEAASPQKKKKPDSSSPTR
jgi:Domain of unknown function (DUF6265)